MSNGTFLTPRTNDNWLEVEDRKMEAVEKMHKQMMINQSVVNVIAGVRAYYVKWEAHKNTTMYKWGKMRGAR